MQQATTSHTACSAYHTCYACFWELAPANSLVMQVIRDNGQAYSPAPIKTSDMVACLLVGLAAANRLVMQVRHCHGKVCSPVPVKRRDMMGRVLRPKGPSQLLLPTSLDTGTVTGKGCRALPFLYHLMTHPPPTWALDCDLHQRPHMPAVMKVLGYSCPFHLQLTG